VELEQRVKTLEYELKILKNEIQRTLLDIHEQVLIHYYPTLRMEETQAPATVVQAVETARAKQPMRPEAAATAAPPPPAPTPVAPVAPPVPAAPLLPTPTPVAPVAPPVPVASPPPPAPAMSAPAPEPAAPPDAPAEAPVTSVKRVSLNDIRAARTEAAAAVPSSSPQANLIKLVEWTVNAAARFGNDRTVQLVDTLAKKGIVDRATKNALFQVISLNKAPAPERVAVNDLLDEMLKLDKLLGRTADAEAALTLIEEAGLG
jgi:outer membrane biosynthesis protein TonB